METLYFIFLTTMFKRNMFESYQNIIVSFSRQQRRGDSKNNLRS